MNDPFISTLNEGDPGKASTPDSAGSEPEKHQDEAPEKEQINISDTMSSVEKNKDRFAST